jgi:hypothetical protein
LINLDGRAIILHLWKLFIHHVVIIYATIWNALIYLVWTPNIHNLYPKNGVYESYIPNYKTSKCPFKPTFYIHTIGPLTNTIRSILLMLGSLIKFESKKFELFWMQKLKFFKLKKHTHKGRIQCWFVGQGRKIFCVLSQL